MTYNDETLNSVQIPVRRGRLDLGSWIDLVCNQLDSLINGLTIWVSCGQRFAGQIEYLFFQAWIDSWMNRWALAKWVEGMVRLQAVWQHLGPIWKESFVSRRFLFKMVSRIFLFATSRFIGVTSFCTMYRSKMALS